MIVPALQYIEGQYFVKWRLCQLCSKMNTGCSKTDAVVSDTLLNRVCQPALFSPFILFNKNDRYKVVCGLSDQVQHPVLIVVV